jgi:hypothetical protein
MKLMKFNPKKHFKNKITSDSCNHLVVSTNGFDEGQYGNTYDCLICGKHLRFPYYEDLNHKNRFVITTFGCLTPYKILIYKRVITIISERYQNRSSLDIVPILNDLEPVIKNLESEITKNDRDNERGTLEEGLKILEYKIRQK